MSSSGGSSRNYVGRVIITEFEPAKPYEFTCWLMDSGSLNIEVGSLLVADGERQETMICIVEDMDYTSTAKSAATEFFGSGFGDPNATPRTRGVIIRKAKLRVLLRNPPRNAPPEGRWRIRYLEQIDIRTLAGAVPGRYQILSGFLKIGLDESKASSWLPLPIHSEWLLGPQGAHANITGITGLATKTSYALFLAYSILSWGRINDEKIAIVLFNVKREDFLRLHNLPSNWRETNVLISEWARNVGVPRLAQRIKALWRAARRFGVDPISDPPQVRYFTYQGDPDARVMIDPQYYRYGLGDIQRGDLVAGLFRPDESPGQQLNLLDAYLDAIQGRPKSFDQMQNDLDQIRLAIMRGRPPPIPIGTWFEPTVRALSTRLRGFISRSTRVLERRQPSGRPIRFASLVEGLNVIQLYRLLDQEKRLVVNAVIREISDGLEAPQRTFDRVIVIVDELNMYAPRGRSPIKEQIINIVARGRDLRFTLIGAEQFASEIDGQVYGNSGTKIIGRSDISELSHEIYRFLRGFKEATTTLDKGQMIVYHPLYPSPMLVWFPTPIHELSSGR